MDQQRGRTVVVGIDGSESALRAVRWAAVEAARRRVPLRVVTAFEWTQDHAVGQLKPGSSYREIMLGQARRHLSEAASAAEQAADGLEVERQLIVGSPIPVLTAESRLAQLVVIGDRGLGGVAGLLLGSVATALSAHADAPLVVVRGDHEVPDLSGPIVVGIDSSPVSEAALAFAFDAAAAREVPLIAVHTWWDAFVEPALAPLLDWDAIESDEHRALAERYPGHEPGLARTLARYSEAMVRTGDQQRALAAGREVLELYRRRVGALGLDETLAFGRTAYNVATLLLPPTAPTAAEGWRAATDAFEQLTIVAQAGMGDAVDGARMLAEAFRATMDTG
jgi:nucleotide-binding universal stress UspA family protein